MRFLAVPKTKKTRYQVGVAVGILCLVGVFYLGVLTGTGKLHFGRSQYSDVTGLPPNIDYSQVTQLYNILRQNYDGKLTSTQIIDGLKHGLADAPGDPYTEYFSASEAKEFNNELQGQALTGIGAQLDADASGNIVVMSPLPGQPADKAGIKAKDIIANINGQSTAGMSITDAVNKIRGPKGSKVTLVIVRGNQQITFTVTRDNIQIPTATSKILDGNVGYLQVSQFSDNTVSLVQKAVQSFKDAGVKKVVLDLRDDPGGEVSTAQQLASLWLKPGDIIEQEKRGSTVVDSLQATSNNSLQGMPTVVLVDAGSASASEITTLALRDHHAAYVIGEKSYGKGVVQQLINLGDGSELKVTVAKWYSPNGTNINHAGIKPDETVGISDADAKAGTDTQLNAALNYLKSK